MSLVLIGSGPGIGLATAKLFASKTFSKIALISRDITRLNEQRSAVQDAARQTGKQVDVHIFPADVRDLSALRKALEQTEKLGPVGCVYFNPARINMTDILTTSVEEIEEDFKTTNLGFYVTAQWAIPLLQKSGTRSPSLFVTSSHLPESPIPSLLSLSAVKASQQNMVMSLNQAFGRDIHIAVVKVSGVVSPEEPNLNPTFIAETTWGLYSQEKGQWADRVAISP